MQVQSFETLAAGTNNLRVDEQIVVKGISISHPLCWPDMLSEHQVNVLPCDLQLFANFCWTAYSDVCL